LYHNAFNEYNFGLTVELPATPSVQVMLEKISLHAFKVLTNSLYGAWITCCISHRYAGITYQLLYHSLMCLNCPWILLYQSPIWF